MASPAVPRVSLADYFRLEEQSETRHEYFGGEVFEMDAATLAHQQIIMETGFALRQVAKGRGCTVLSAGVRVAVPDGLYTYPDLALFCGKLQPSPADADTFVNPILLIEVLSPSTAGYDRGAKFRSYRGIPSLREYITIDQRAPQIERHFRDHEGRWVTEDIDGLESTLRIDTLDLDLPLAAIYSGVEFPAPAA